MQIIVLKRLRAFDPDNFLKVPSDAPIKGSANPSNRDNSRSQVTGAAMRRVLTSTVSPRPRGVLFLIALFCAGGCSDHARPARSDAISQVKNYDWTVYLGKQHVYDFTPAILVNSKVIKPYIAPAQVEYANGYALDPNNYIVAVHVEFQYTESAPTVRSEIERACKSAARELKYVCEWNLSFRDTGFKPGQTASTKDAQFRFLKTENGWLLQNMLNPPE